MGLGVGVEVVWLIQISTADPVGVTSLQRKMIAWEGLGREVEE